MMTHRADDDPEEVERVERLRLMGAVEKKEAVHAVDALVPVFNRWGKRIVLWAAAATILGAIAIAMGWRLSSPATSLAATNARIDTMAVVQRVLNDTLAARIARGDADRKRIEAIVTDNVTLTCTLIRMASPPGSVMPTQCRNPGSNGNGVRPP